MSLLATTWLYNGSNLTGSSELIGLGESDRYAKQSATDLKRYGLYNSISSGQLTCLDADLSLAIFNNQGYAGQFRQLSMSRDLQQTDFWHAGRAESALVIASNKRNTAETRLSFVDLFLNQWNTYLDSQLQGTPASRRSNQLTWLMFPENHQYLDPNQSYLCIHQDLHISIPVLPDYSAWFEYYVSLYVDPNGHVRCWVPADYIKVEDGAKHSAIHHKIDPVINAGMSTLTDQVNQELMLFDQSGPFSEVYFLPGSQLDPITSGQTSIYGQDSVDDVTIVIVQMN